MIYRNGKKMGALFLNGKATSQLFRDGKLVWQKAKPEAKRVKSIKVALPEWGTPERIEWESILRAVPADIRNYYLDAMVKGIGVRLRGYGGQHAGKLSGETIVLPDSLEVTTDDVYVGQVVSFVAKLPAVTSTPTYKHSTSSYKKDAFYQFENAPFLNGSVFKADVTGSVLKRPTWELKADLTGANASLAPAHTITGTVLGGLWMEYKDQAFRTMAKGGTAFWKTLKPSFYITLSASGKISNPTLTSPESRLTFKFKIKQIETY